MSPSLHEDPDGLTSARLTLHRQGQRSLWRTHTGSHKSFWSEGLFQIKVKVFDSHSSAGGSLFGFLQNSRRDRNQSHLTPQKIITCSPLLKLIVFQVSRFLGLKHFCAECTAVNQSSFDFKQCIKTIMLSKNKKLDLSTSFSFF